MDKLSANDIRVGNIVEHQGNLCSVVKTDHTKPGKGVAYVQMEMKDIVTGIKFVKRFRSSDRISKVSVREVQYQYLYSAGDFLMLMDNESCEQVEIPISLLGNLFVFLKEEMIVTVTTHENKFISAKPPVRVVLEVKDTESVIKGQTISSSFKPAILENDVKIMVPPFIKAGDKIVVSTTDLTYVERENRT